MRWTTYNKYGNHKTQYKGIKFDSKKECEYFIYLEQLEALGGISELQRQVRFELQPSFKHKGKTIRAITYLADFTFKDRDGELHIVDVKGTETIAFHDQNGKYHISNERSKRPAGIKTDVYLMKKKMMQFKGYDIEEV